MWAHDIYQKIANSNTLENLILKGSENNETKGAAQFVVDSLDELVRLANEYNFVVTIAVIPVSAQVANDYPSEKYKSALKQYAVQHSLDFLDFLPMLRNYYEQSGKQNV